MNELIIFIGIIKKDYIKYYLDISDFLKKKILFSTWDYIDEEIINLLKINNFNVIQNKFPEDIEKKSVNFQNYSTKMGVEYAIKNNYTHVFRLRADLLPTNLEKLIFLYKKIWQENKLIFITYYHHGEGYLIDHVYFGKTNDIYKYVNIFQSKDNAYFPEKFLQYSYFGHNDIDKLKEQVIFSIKHLLDNNITFYFIKEEYINQKDLLNGYIKSFKCEF